MININDLISVADAYICATDLPDSTVSHRVFSDSKKLKALRSGADLTTSRFNSALIWFSKNWPDGGEWPDGVSRPLVEAAQ